MTMKRLLKNNVWRVVLVLAAIMIAWKIISVNLADHFVKLAGEGDQDALESALFWDAGHPRVLVLQGERLLESGQEDLAEKFLIEAVQANPADARPLILLADIRRKRGEESVADQMVETASRLMPVDGNIQRAVAVYWYERGMLDLAVEHLSTALAGNYWKLRDELFPVFLKIAETPGAHETLAPLAEDPPLWWEGFVVYATKNAENVDTLRVIATMRKSSDKVPISKRERNTYIQRLRKEGLLAEAYLHWVNGLDKEQRQLLGYIYNGNFEHELSNSGFGWYARLPKNSGIIINTAITYGIEGKQALYLSFKGKRVRFRHLRQPLFLDAGTYRVTGRVRPDKLRARKGLQWVALCTVGAKGKLGESRPFLGTGDWREFEFDINVPPECRGQLLQLRSVGNRDVDHEVKGEIWFDDMHIQLQRQELRTEHAEQVSGSVQEPGSEIDEKNQSK